jgi:cell division septal protein FtsQ
MVFRRKQPKRLYYPTKSRWYRKPKRRRLSGRTSRKIFSYNIRTHFSHFLKDFFLYVVGGLVLIGLVIFVLFSSRFSITSIEVARDDLHIDSAAITHLLADYRGKSIFTFSKKEAREMIRNEYPEFARVEVRKLLPNTIKIELETHEIVANIRAYYVLPKAESAGSDKKDLEIEKLNDAFETAFNLEGEPVEEKEQIIPIEQKALLNRIGQAIFDRSEDLQLMTITVDGLSQPIEDREVVIPAERMDYILNSIKYLTNLMQLEVSGVRYLPRAREVHLTTADGLTLWLSLEKDYKTQIDKLNVIYKAAELNKENLAYIDLRVKEKIIYCPRGSSCDR